MPYYLDVVGYMFLDPRATDAGVSYVRSLLVAPQPGYVAKDGTGRIPGPVIELPNGQPHLEQLYALLENNHHQPQEDLA